jgi:hypothetical protein
LFKSKWEQNEKERGYPNDEHGLFKCERKVKVYAGSSRSELIVCCPVALETIVSHVCEQYLDNLIKDSHRLGHCI